MIEDHRAYLNHCPLILVHVQVFSFFDALNSSIFIKFFLYVLFIMVFNIFSSILHILISISAF